MRNPFFLNRSTFTVALLGFSQTERIALTSMIALSERRGLRYSIGEDYEADLVVVDSDNQAVMTALANSRSAADAVLIGDVARHLARAAVPRPVEWHRLLKQLDILVRTRQQDETENNPDSPPTLPLTGMLDPVPSSTIVKAVIRGTADVRARARGDLAQASKIRVPTDSLKAARPAAAPSFKGTVLVVGASAAVQDFVKTQLSAVCVETEASDSPESAIARTGERDYDCLIVDMSSGGIGAYATCRALKSRRGAPRIVLIGHGVGPVDRMRARLAGADAVLAKPLSRTQLLTTIGPIGAT